MTRAAAKKAREQQRELPPPFGRAVTDDDVWECCYSAHGWLTRRQIADGIGRRVTPGLVARIEDMVERRMLERRVFVMANKAEGYQYRALEDGE